MSAAVTRSDMAIGSFGEAMAAWDKQINANWAGIAKAMNPLGEAMAAWQQQINANWAGIAKAMNPLGEAMAAWQQQINANWAGIAIATGLSAGAQLRLRDVAATRDGLLGREDSGAALMINASPTLDEVVDMPSIELTNDGRSDGELILQDLVNAWRWLTRPNHKYPVVLLALALGMTFFLIKAPAELDRTDLYKDTFLVVFPTVLAVLIDAWRRK